MKINSKKRIALLLTAVTSIGIVGAVNGVGNRHEKLGLGNYGIIMDGTTNTYTDGDVFDVVTDNGSTVQFEVGNDCLSAQEGAFCKFTAPFNVNYDYYVGNKTPISGIETVKVSCKIIDYEDDGEMFGFKWGWSKELENEENYMSSVPHFDEKSTFIYDIDEDEYIVMFDFFEEKPSFFRITPFWYDTIINYIEITYSCEASEIDPIYETDLCKNFARLYEQTMGYYTPSDYRGEGVESITIPSSFRGYPIGWFSGNGISGLTGVKTLTLEGEGFGFGSGIAAMFYDCDSLETIYFPDDFYQASRPKNGGAPIKAFINCPNVEHIYVDNDFVTSDDDHTCFIQNNNLFLGTKATVTVPSNVTKICAGAFDGCEMNIVIPSTVTAIEKGAFRGVSGDIYLPFEYDAGHTQVPSGYKAGFIDATSIRLHYSNGMIFTGSGESLTSIINGYAE